MAPVDLAAKVDLAVLAADVPVVKDHKVEARKPTAHDVQQLSKHDALSGERHVSACRDSAFKIWFSKPGDFHRRAFHLSSVICHLSSVICHLSSVICHLS